MMEWSEWSGVVWAKILVFCGVFTLISSGQAATVITVIDSFSDGVQEISISGGPGEHIESSQNNAIGGERDIRFFVSSNPLSRTASMQIASGGDETLRLNFGTLAVGGAWLNYDGIAGAGLAGTDLTDNGATGIGFQVDFLDVPTRLTVELTDRGGDSDEIVIEHGGQLYDPELFYFPFAGFGVDVSDIDGIAIGVEPLVGGGDVILSFVGATLPPPIPEPGSAALILMGALLLGSRRRRGH